MPGLDELVKAKADYDAKIKADGEAAIKAELAALFERHPKLLGIKWTQYTPYFNDGEPCTFGIHEPDVVIEGCRDESAWAIKYYANDRGYGPDVLAIGEDIAKFYHAIQQVSDAMEAAFGDHAEITVTRDGITVDEYSHE
jgi:hypothetical protein